MREWEAAMKQTEGPHQATCVSFQTTACVNAFEEKDTDKTETGGRSVCTKAPHKHKGAAIDLGTKVIKTKQETSALEAAKEWICAVLCRSGGMCPGHTEGKTGDGGEVWVSRGRDARFDAQYQGRPMDPKLEAPGHDFNGTRRGIGGKTN
ncbi:hypothetical protein TRVL_08286 [Trypanosoma vivax]|nr:hypothetical protein TRVL_08286 [Trypanosoma vivax]